MGTMDESFVCVHSRRYVISLGYIAGTKPQTEETICPDPWIVGEDYFDRHPRFALVNHLIKPSVS